MRLQLAIVAAAAAATATGIVKADNGLITDLPGAEGMDFPNMYSGYLDLPNTEKHVFFWYVEAEKDPETAPVALWTNGGPGCSGLTGFMTEQGPFHVGAEGQLEKNPYAWNTLANMFFIEQPVGVGFSYSDDPAADYSPGDWDAARDNYAAILTFLETYPNLKNNDFYITAESYGGHYMPTLAKYIVDHNTDNAINFKGFAVGNPFTSKATNGLGEFNTLYGHQLVSKPRFESWQRNCGAHYKTAKEAELSASVLDGPLPIFTKPYRCLIDEEAMLGSIELNLNPYALDFPTCPRGGDDDEIKKSVAAAVGGRGGGRFGGAQRLQLLRAKYADEPNLLKVLEKGLTKGQQKHAKGPDDVVTAYEPCTDQYATAYLNRLDVQNSIHVNGGAAHSNDTVVSWDECSRSIRYNMSDSRTPMMPIYQYLLDPANDFDLKLLVFSGDDDDVCATEGSQEWIYDLGFDTAQDVDGIYDLSWHAWHYDDDTFGRQTGGFTVNFNQSQMSGMFAFTTAHGCGHEVPTYKPQLALEIFRSYLSGDVFLPTS